MDSVLHCVRTGPEPGQVSAQIRSQHAENPQVSAMSQAQTRDRDPSRGQADRRHHDPPQFDTERAYVPAPAQAGGLVHTDM